MRLWGSVSKGLRPNSLPTLMNVMMLGARGVGKTSVLTSMYEQLKPIIDASHLQLTPDDESAARLGERLAELRSLPDNFEATGGIEGDQDFREYIFRIGKIGEKPDMSLRFTDCPGGALASDASAAQKERIYELMRTCQVVIIAINTPALMEQLVPETDGSGRIVKYRPKWDERMNRTFQITALFQNHYQNLQGNRLILLVPVKCELYLKEAQKEAQKDPENKGPQTTLFLRRMIKDSYSDLLAFLRRQSVAVVITPVQTVGTVVFSDITVENGVPNFHFRRIGPNAGYSPRDTEQPLRYLLRFFVREYHRAKMSGFLGVWNFFTGKYEYMLKAAETLANGCKDQSDPSRAFEIIQGDDLL